MIRMLPMMMDMDTINDGLNHITVIYHNTEESSLSDHNITEIFTFGVTEVSMESIFDREESDQ